MTEILPEDDVASPDSSYRPAMTLRRPTLVDTVLAAVVLVLGVAGAASGGLVGPRWVAYASVGLYVACLLLRRTSLWLVVVVAFATVVGSYALGLSQQDFLASIVACLVLVWWIGYHLGRAESVLGLCYAFACVTATNGLAVANVLWLVLVIGGAWGAGRALRSRRLLIEDLRRATVELEHSREALAERAVADERLRIAQEIHDVVAHSVTVMLVQAEAAERVMPGGEANRPARQAIRNVQDSARQALTELRQMLGVLRPDARAPTEPQPRLDDLAALVASYEGVGLRVACTEPGGVPLPPSVELTAYRVAQEALTNVLRHSAAREAAVDVRAEGGSLVVEIVDEGPARPITHPRGHGLVGMRERVIACGGELDVGPDGTGYRVRAVLPIGAVS